MATAPTPQIDTGYFFQQIAHQQRRVLILDFDTTLCLLGTTPNSAFPLPNVAELLDCIITCGRTRVIVTSSRDAADVVAQLAPPYPEIWGRNGRERMSAHAAGAGVPFCIHPCQQTTALPKLLASLCAGGPVAYVMGEARHRADRLFVRPEFHLSPTEVAFGGREDFVQFLVDWLRACAGEIC